MAYNITVRPGLPNSLFEQPLPVVQYKVYNWPWQSPAPQCTAGQRSCCLVGLALPCRSLFRFEQALPQSVDLGIPLFRIFPPLPAKLFNRAGTAFLKTGGNRNHQGIQLIKKHLRGTTTGITPAAPFLKTFQPGHQGLAEGFPTLDVHPPGQIEAQPGNLPGKRGVQTTGFEKNVHDPVGHIGGVDLPGRPFQVHRPDNMGHPLIPLL